MNIVIYVLDLERELLDDQLNFAALFEVFSIHPSIAPSQELSFTTYHE